MKKSTLIKEKDLDNILKIKELVNDYPNDMELGSRVRALFWESKPHYPSKEMRDRWNGNEA